MSESSPATPPSDLPPVPPVLLSRRRKVKSKKFFGGMMALRLFLLPHTIVGLGAAGAAAAYPIWIKFGTDHTAQVTAARYYTTTSDKGKETPYFEIKYHYMLGDQRREHTENVDEDVFTRIGATREPSLEAPAYKPVTVRALGRPPMAYDAVIDGDQSPWAKWGFILIFAAFWNGVMCIFWWSAYVVPWRMRKLYRTGRVGFGVITRKYTSGGKSRANYLEYDFFTEDGAAGHGKTAVPVAADFERAAERENVIVLHADGKTKPSVVYAYGMYRCVE